MDRYGGPDVLELRDVPTPVPGPGEVLVRIRAASVNDWDWGLLDGKSFVNRMLSGVFKPRIRILGGDIAGCVEEVGSNVQTFHAGDEVYGDLCASGFGAFAEYVCAPQSVLAHKPPAMSFEQAAAIPQAGMLAVQGLIDVGRIRSGQTLLLNGAGGGVGTFAIQIAKLYDARVTAVDKAAKLEMLSAMGADRVVDYAREDFTRAGERYDLILDAKTDRSLLAYARSLNPGGAYVTVGGDTWRLAQIFALGPALRRVTGMELRVVLLRPNKDLALVNELFEAGKLVPVIDRVYELKDVPEALRRFGTGDHKGKVVVTVGR